MHEISLAAAAPLDPQVVEAHLHALDTRGYSLISGLLDDAACELLSGLLAGAIAGYEPRAGSERSGLDRYLLHDLLCRDLAFCRLLEDPRLQQLVAPVLGDHWIMYAFTSSSVPPGGTNYGRRVHVDSPRFVPDYVFNLGLLWALDPFTVQNGATEVLPGSHRVAEAPSQEQFELGCEQVICGRGDLLVFNARLSHRSGVNRTGAWRHALTMNCCRSYMKQRMDWVRFVPQETAARLGPQARRLIGYDTRLPTSLEEFFLPEAERLYKANQG